MVFDELDYRVPATKRQTRLQICRDGSSNDEKFYTSASARMDVFAAKDHRTKGTIQFGIHRGSIIYLRHDDQ